MTEASRHRPLRAAIAQQGRSFRELQRSAAELVLFGSRAAGVEREDSDFDLLLVGHERPKRTRTVDWVWVSPERLCSAEWLGSELAGHVARYGTWLWGTPNWIERVWRSRAAIAHKAAVISGRIRALDHTFALLAAPYVRKHLLRLRRDLQRHACLLEGEAVPPTAFLDGAWSQAVDRQQELLRLSGLVGRREQALMSRFLVRAPSLAG